MQIDKEDTRILEAGISFVFDGKYYLIIYYPHCMLCKVCYGSSIDTDAGGKGVIKETSLCLKKKWDHF